MEHVVSKVLTWDKWDKEDLNLPWIDNTARKKAPSNVSYGTHCTYSSMSCHCDSDHAALAARGATCRRNRIRCSRDSATAAVEANLVDENEEEKVDAGVGVMDEATPLLSPLSPL